MSPILKKYATYGYGSSKGNYELVRPLTDYEINYKPIFTQKNIDKLHKLECFLTDICDRMTRNNPLSNYFLSIVKDKLGKKEESIKRKKIALNNLEKSDYWEKRFKVLDIIL